MHDGMLLLKLLLFRGIILLIIQTSYVPDEYYQYPEPSFHIAFPYSHQQNLTWEWGETAKIRSYLPLLPLIGLYRLVGFANAEFQMSLVFICPRLLQTLLTTLSDWYYYKLARWCYNSHYARLALLVHIFSWYGMYCLSRTLSNSTEHALLIIGTYFLCRRNKCWQWKFFTFSNFYLSILIAVFSCFVRPTVVLFWIPMFAFTLKDSKNILRNLSVLKMVGCAAFVVQLGILVDSEYYGSFTVAPLNFFVVNIMEKRAESFGISSWHFYLTNGLPVVLGLYLPYYMFGLSLEGIPNRIRSLATLAFWHVVILALVTKHAEHRFLLPFLPFAHLLIGWVVFKLGQQCQTYVEQSTNNFRWLFGNLFFKVVLFCHITVALYMLHFHQAGPEKAFQFLRMRQLRLVEADRLERTLILVGSSCFSFPGISSLNTADQYYEFLQLPCVPPWEGKDIFNHNPAEGFKELFEIYTQKFPGHPAYVLTFDSFVDQLENHPLFSRMSLVQQFHHAHFLYDYDDLFPKYNVFLFHLEP